MVSTKTQPEVDAVEEAQTCGSSELLDKTTPATDIWELYGTSCDCTLNNKPKSKHYILFAIDIATSKVVITKTFYSNTKDRTCSTKQVIKAIEQALEAEQVKEPLEINTGDRSEFRSQEFIDFANKNPLIKSWCPFGGIFSKNEKNPYTFEKLTEYLLCDLPKNVERTSILQNRVVKRINILNTQGSDTRDTHLSPNPCLLDGTRPFLEHDPSSNRTTLIVPIRPELSGREKFRDDVREGTILCDLVKDDQRREYGVSIKNINLESKDDVEEILKKVDKINEVVLPMHKAQTLCDPIPKTVFEAILKDDKPKGTHTLSWSRFKLTASLLFFSGLKLSEVAQIKKDDVEGIIKNHRLSVYQSKVNKYRNLRFTKKGVETIQKVFNESKNIVYKDYNVLFPLPQSNRKNTDKFCRSINKFLKIYDERGSFRFTSHSFRCGFISQALKHTSTHNAQTLAGHTDIKSTIKYNRFILDPDKEIDILNKMFDD